MGSPLTCADIQRILFSHYLRSDIIICPNTEAIGAEADLLVVQPTGYIAEIEIKVSRSDFWADFKKEGKHRALAAGKRTRSNAYDAPNHFYFAVPAGLVTAEEVPNYCGLLYIYGGLKDVKIIRGAPRLHTNKCGEKTLRRITRSLMYKVFSAGTHCLPEHANLAWQPEEGGTHA
ncbi:MAG: hypothetical protein ACRYFX_29245 [Janthinobacterium lividum]